MEHANKAIIMAFGMLVAVMIMGTIAFVFTRLKSLPTQDDEIDTIEQRRLFNQEYEVYDKKIMYGVDVISVLNKAQSNNEKYVEGNFLSGNLYNTDYIINIVVNFKTPLEEKLDISYLEETTTKIVEKEYTTGQGPIPTLKVGNVFKTGPSRKYQEIIYHNPVAWNNFDFKVFSEKRVTSGKYQLLSGSITASSYPDSFGEGTTHYTNDMLNNDDSTLKQLLTQSATMSHTVRNTGTNTKIDGWNRATWYPAIYSMKTRKFKCIGEHTTYSSKTGRIVFMEFEEF